MNINDPFIPIKYNQMKEHYRIPRPNNTYYSSRILCPKIKMEIDNHVFLITIRDNK